MAYGRGLLNLRPAKTGRAGSNPATSANKYLSMDPSSDALVGVRMTRESARRFFLPNKNY